MALKVRKGYIIALIVIAIIFTGFYSLKFFFKKSLEEELNKVFNAQVKIGKIDLKLANNKKLKNHWKNYMNKIASP